MNLSFPDFVLGADSNKKVVEAFLPEVNVITPSRVISLPVFI